MKIIKTKRKELEIRAAISIEKKIHEYLKTQKQVILGISGGTSVTGIFNLLKTQNIPWNKVHIFWVDERLVPTDSPDNNYNHAYDILLDFLTKQKKIKTSNIHPYNYFNLPIEKGLEAYKNELRELSHHIDIIILGVGEDSHVASLFPNHDSINNQSEFFIYVNNSPKLPRERISASRKLLEKSRTALLLFFGEKKSQAYKDFKNKDLSVIDCPAKLINNIQDSYVFTDLK